MQKISSSFNLFHSNSTKKFCSRQTISISIKIVHVLYRLPHPICLVSKKTKSGKWTTNVVADETKITDKWQHRVGTWCAWVVWDFICLSILFDAKEIQNKLSLANVKTFSPKVQTSHTQSLKINLFFT